MIVWKGHDDSAWSDGTISISMTSMKDPYSILGVTRAASQEEIKRAYRGLAKELHPDRHPGDSAAAERFKEVSAAYNLLGDAAQRARFDRGEIGADGAEKAPHGYHYANAGGADEFTRGGFSGPRGFEDIVGDIFGGFRGGRGGPVRGRDRKYSLTVDFLEAARGGNRRLTLPGGKTLDVRIPEGLEDGQQIRLKGQGDQPQGGTAGDAMIEVSVRLHPLFSRDGRDINLELPISLREAVLGAKITAPTIHGDVTISIPKGSNAGRVLRLKGRGIRNPKDNSAGDQYVKLKVVLPEVPDAELEKFVRGWRQGEDHDPRAGLRSG